MVLTFTAPSPLIFMKIGDAYPDELEVSVDFLGITGKLMPKIHCPIGTRIPHFFAD